MLARTSIPPMQWNLLCERIHKGFCVPFLGAGVNIGKPDKYEGLPAAAGVVKSLVEELLGRPVESLDSLAKVDADAALQQQFADLCRPGLHNLARVALYAEAGADPEYFMSLLRKIVPDEERAPSELLNVLAGLPLRLIVTTNYDRLMERALDPLVDQGTRPPYKRVVQPVKGFDAKQQRRLENALKQHPGLVLYKIHGTFGIDGEPDHESDLERVIITEEDYIEFLTVVGTKDAGVPALIRSRIVDSTLLFLGYGLEDWDFRTLFKALVEKLPVREQRRSFAIQKDPTPFWIDLWSRKGVEIYNIDIHEFGGELAERYRARWGDDPLV
jgi:hypothetical protein